MKNNDQKTSMMQRAGGWSRWLLSLAFVLLWLQSGAHMNQINL